LFFLIIHSHKKAKSCKELKIMVETDAVVAGSSQEETPHKEFISDGKYRNKQRCLVLCLRGATARYRHLLEDLRTLLPHHKKESKLDPGKSGVGRAVNDIAQIRGCNTVLFLECRKRQDAYLWLGRVGNDAGPSARFHLTNAHTMDELRLTGNCMKGSRPVLTFDESFGRVGHLKLLKELFIDVFGTPRGHPASKPFVDRVMAFYFVDDKVSLFRRKQGQSQRIGL
jgi:ribosome biogenesis protein BRX1